MVTIKVLWRDTGKPAKGSRVAIGFDGFTRGVTDSEYSDSDGEAHFDAESDSGEVYVDGDTKHRGRIAGRVVVYI
jgi:hypothetical protein